MNPSGKTTLIAGSLFLALFAGSAISRHQVDKRRGAEATLEDVLYLPSGKTVKRLSLGYSGLLANIYWTRAVQYFGSKHIRHAQRYDLLYPLLEITTDLDPKLIVAYENGAVFLSQQPPDGAGQPDKAVALLERGIRENPEYWRLYFTLGFVHYIDRKDPKSAQMAFQRGSEVPGALPWMRVMAARMAEHSRDITTAMALWQAILETTTDKDVREGAQRHLVSMQADRDIDELERRVKIYRQRMGRLPASWADLINARLLDGVPITPFKDAYVLHADGKVAVKDPSKYPYLGEWLNNTDVPF
jgi:tetratricopeptide (TPR) repeat protein